MSRRTILFLSWRDQGHPSAGGAEVYTHEVLRRLVAKGFRIWHFSAAFVGGASDEIVDGVRYVRRGGRLSVIPYAVRFYRKHAAEVDLVVDQCNTHRFFTPAWVPREKRLFFIHQLTREIWYQMVPRVPAEVGFRAEKVALWLNRRDRTITVSESTRRDLVEAGFHADRVAIAPEGLTLAPVETLEPKRSSILLYAGRVNPYKGVEIVIRAFAQVRKHVPDARLWIVGKSAPEYFARVLLPLVKRLDISVGTGPLDEGHDVHFFGYLPEHDLHQRMFDARLLVMASTREGWGLTISEAAALGTPSVVWPAPGVVDAVDCGRAGFLCRGRTLDALVESVLGALTDAEEYERMRVAAHRFACTLSFDNSAQEFERCIQSMLP